MPSPEPLARHHDNGEILNSLLRCSALSSTSALVCAHRVYNAYTPTPTHVCMRMPLSFDAVASTDVVTVAVLVIVVSVSVSVCACAFFYVFVDTFSFIFHCEKQSVQNA